MSEAPTKSGRTLISVLICTRNRLPALKKTISSVGRLVLSPDVDAELVIVDNGSTDGTAEWARHAELPNMPVRCVQEPRPGTGYARTTALWSARGDILLFTDDDVELPEDWAETMILPILVGSADVVGGRSALASHLRRSWMTDFHYACLASLERAKPNTRRGLFTISMAMHRRVLERVPAFDPELGPGSRYGYLEDTLFTWQLVEAGCRIELAWDNVVIHDPGPDRLRRSTFLRAAKNRGRSRTYVRYHWEHRSEEAWTHRNRPWQLWRHPRVVLVKRFLQLNGWRLMHLPSVLSGEGIDRTEFALIDQFFQIWQYLTERKRPRNYDLRGLNKLRGVLPTVSGSQHLIAAPT